jgi:hypothetical protein
MNNMVNLIAMAGADKTLIIACGQYSISKHIQFNENIFIHSLHESTLRNHDPLEKGMIQYYIENKGCTKVVIVGSVQEDLVARLSRSESLLSPAASLRFNTKVFLRNQDREIIPETLRDHMLVELHVISQCNLLMDYYFIRERLTNSELRIRGCVIEHRRRNLKEIFCNGTIYNDIISMN